MAKERKFLALTNSDLLKANVKKIANGWWNIGSCIFFYYDKEVESIGKLRDKITNGERGQIAIIEILTTGNAAAQGLSQEAWDWCSEFCNDDTEKIEEASIKEYKKQNKEPSLVLDKEPKKEKKDNSNEDKINNITI